MYDGQPLDLVHDDRYPVDVAWGDSPIYLLPVPHPVAPPPILLVQPLQPPSVVNTDQVPSTSNSPPTASQLHLMPIPPIVDHLLDEIDELKEALAVEVERGRGRELELEALRKEVGELRNTVSGIVAMGRTECIEYALLGKKACDVISIAEPLVE
ncbi:hypothetical protein DFP72DRAFT_924041 [Ephemerocybe angulata]|uniref:Uncharacterized protein n=1 Tax=Ephemerocybe angulata TaxID=980116 RepID=A0A8H6LYJ6_9AGAR|nr:hypothetical protein DFP72DRAFT_924041 [Tulosesus angulatus]